MDENNIESFMADWIHSRIQLSLNAVNMFETHTETPVPIGVEANFQNPTYARLFEANNISQYNETCYPVIHQIIVDKLAQIIQCALVIRDNKNRKIITHSDIITAIRMFGKRITKN